MASFVSDSEVVDINDYALQLLKETCPTMHESEMLQMAESLVKEATVQVKRREKLRRRLNKKVKLAAQTNHQEIHENSQQCPNQHNVPTIATNSAEGKSDTTFHGAESLHNHRRRNFENYGNTLRQRNCGPMPWNNFNTPENWRYSVPTFATNSTGGNSNTTFHSVESFHNYRGQNFPTNHQASNYQYWYDQNNYENHGTMPYNNFDSLNYWRNGCYKSVPTYYYPKRKNEMPHGNFGSKRMRS